MAATSLSEAISRFGRTAKAKLAGYGASGEPEDQLRAPFEALLSDIVAILGFGASQIVAVGESSVADLKTRPDYAVTRMKALVGFIELKAPGKGADPRLFKDEHDKKQWIKLRSLPNPSSPTGIPSVYGTAVSLTAGSSISMDRSRRPAPS
jgi:hypothetical protein